MEFFGRCTANLVYFQLYLCFLRTDNVQQMENTNWWGVLKETGLKSIDSDIHRIQQYSTVSL